MPTRLSKTFLAMKLPENVVPMPAEQRGSNSLTRAAKRGFKRKLQRNETPELFAVRFWEKVNKTAGCWIWEGALGRKGYGRFVTSSGLVGAHRVAYQLANGPFDLAMFVCHSCDNPKCVNPAHLFLGSNHDNMVDMIAKKRNVNQQKTHCPLGHEYSGTNLIIRTRQGRANYRVCRACEVINKSRRMAVKSVNSKQKNGNSKFS